jgi:hypothetical protein
MDQRQDVATVAGDNVSAGELLPGPWADQATFSSHKYVNIASSGVTLRIAVPRTRNQQGPAGAADRVRPAVTTSGRTR